MSRSLALAEARKLKPLDYARGRLAEWGNVLTDIKHFDAPNPNYYCRSAFAPGVSDHNVALTLGERGERAIEIDNMMMALEAVSPKSFWALYVYYAVNRPGRRSRMPEKERLEVYRQETGEGRTSYYEARRVGEDYICRRLHEVDSMMRLIA